VDELLLGSSETKIRPRILLRRRWLSSLSSVKDGSEEVRNETAV
jgi:hypothetical protein